MIKVTQFVFFCFVLITNVVLDVPLSSQTADFVCLQFVHEAKKQLPAAGNEVNKTSK